MPNKAAALATLGEKLEGLNWMIDSGMAVEIYTGGKRVANDIDVVILEKDMDEAARRLGTNVTTRSADKNGLQIINEKYASTTIEDMTIELVCGSGEYMINGKERCMNVTKEHLACARKISYLGVELNVAAREEILVHKTILGREKDKKDVELLLENFTPDEKLLDLFLDMYRFDESEKKDMLAKILK